jgi:hypothetical protein
MSQRSSQPAVHPSEELKTRTVQCNYFTQIGGVSAYHLIQPPSEFEVSLTHHILNVQINTNWDNFRQVTRFAGQEYDGSFSPYGFLLIPAKISTFYCWNEIDESMMSIRFG